MKFYLSSYKFGNDYLRLKELLKVGSKIGYINNSRDWIGVNENNKKLAFDEESKFLENLGFKCELLDLKEYFGKKGKLREKLESLDGLWVCGGNTFVLRQAMKLSGFDELFEEIKLRNDFLWSGYSAGVCILCDSLKYITQVDDYNNFPYEGIENPIYEGLNVFQYGLLPHYQSNNEESDLIDKEVERCIEKRWLFKTLKDGEVLIYDNLK